MSNLLNNYLGDLVYLIKEEYNDSFEELESATGDDKIYYKGQQIAYYSVLSLIESQLIAFDEENILIGKIVPKFGEKSNL